MAKKNNIDKKINNILNNLKLTNISFQHINSLQINLGDYNNIIYKCLHYIYISDETKSEYSEYNESINLCYSLFNNLEKSMLKLMTFYDLLENKKKPCSISISCLIELNYILNMAKESLSIVDENIDKLKLLILSKFTDCKYLIHYLFYKLGKTIILLYLNLYRSDADLKLHFYNICLFLKTFEILINNFFPKSTFKNDLLSNIDICDKEKLLLNIIFLYYIFYISRIQLLIIINSMNGIILLLQDNVKKEKMYISKNIQHMYKFYSGVIQNTINQGKIIFKGFVDNIAYLINFIKIYKLCKNINALVDKLKILYFSLLKDGKDNKLRHNAYNFINRNFKNEGENIKKIYRAVIKNRNITKEEKINKVRKYVKKIQDLYHEILKLNAKMYIK